MTEQELRALVRQAIGRHAGAAPGGGGRIVSAFANVGSHGDPTSQSWPGGPPSRSAPADRRSSLASGGWLDPAHAMFVVPTGADADGPCIIEPAVMCNHCGYCRSMGH